MTKNALLDVRLVSFQYVDIFTIPKIELEPEFDYGYLFQCAAVVRGIRYVGHDGGSSGISNEFRMF